MYFSGLGSWYIVEPRPILNSSLRCLIQRFLTPQNLCGQARALRGKAAHPLTLLLRRPPPRTRWKPRAAQLHTSGNAPGWSPEGRAWGRQGVRMRLLPLAAASARVPPPRRRSAPSGRSGRTPGGARHCPAGEAPRAPVLVERGPFQPKRLEKGSSGECGEPPAHTRLQNLQQSPRFATVKDPREGRAGGARAGSGGVGRGAWRSILARGPQGSDGAEAAKPGGSRQGPEPTLTRGCE